MDNFGALLKNYREKKKLSQKALGERCLLSRIYIASMEASTRKAPPEKTVIRLSQALNLSKKESLLLLESAQYERFLATFRKSGMVREEYVVRCLLNTLNRDQVIRISNKLLANT